MRILLYISTLWLIYGCQSYAQPEKHSALTLIKSALTIEAVDTPKSQYSSIEYEDKEILNAAPGTKSVLFNSDGSRLYAMNLEGMSIYEFDQSTHQLIREFKFKPTKGTGWDYETDKPIPSFEEKPVEACLSHNDQILWVSLHNAEGIVPIYLDPAKQDFKTDPKQSVKTIYVERPGIEGRDSFTVPLIKTGKTPKIISRTADSRHLLVSNWHSNNVSVLETDTSVYPFAKLVKTIPVQAIPRGISVDDKTNKSYIAIMGGASIAVVDNNNGWKKSPDIPVASNPRHIVMDSASRLFVSYNQLGKVACVDAATGKTFFTTKTHKQPRTIILSKNQQFLFVTCYSADTVDVFKINANRFDKVASLPCKGHPVGVDIFEDDNKLEAWVCSYTNGAINIYTFRKKRS